MSWTDVEPKPIKPIRLANKSPVYLRELYDLNRKEDFLIARTMGFNATIGHGKNLIRLANESGFYFTEASWFYSTQYNTTDALSKAIQDEFQQYRNQPGLVSYNLNDEPDLRYPFAPPSFLKQVAHQILTLDPVSKFSVTLSGAERAVHYWEEYGNWLDILRIDPYPLIEGAPLREIIDKIRKAIQSVSSEAKLITVLQGWSVGELLPNRKQILNMAWQSLIGGAHGFSIYNWHDDTWSKNNEFWKTIAGINQLLEDDLEPYLTQGLRYPEKECQQILATLFEIPHQGWRLLAVSLNENENSTEKILIDLPASVLKFIENKTVYISGEKGQNIPHRISPPGKLSLTFDGLESILISSEPIYPKKNLKNSEGPEFYSIDLAGRPWSKLSQNHSWDSLFNLFRSSFQWPQKEMDRQFTGFVKAEMELEITGETAGLEDFNQLGRVFRIFPGGKFDFLLKLKKGKSQSAQLAMDSWEEGSGRNLEIDKTVTIKLTRIDQNPEQNMDLYRLNLILPSDFSFSTTSDSLVKLKLSYHLNETLFEESRVIRLRLEQPFESEWEWSSSVDGVFTFSPRFSEAHYPCSFQDLVTYFYAGETQFDAEPLGSIFKKKVFITADNRNSTTPPSPIPLQVSIGCKQAGPLTAIAFSSLKFQSEKWITPSPPLPLKVISLNENLSFSLNFFRKFSKNFQAIEHFQYYQGESFFPDQNQAWLFQDLKNLYWYMRLHSPEPLRAETKPGDTSFLGDDYAGLWISTPVEGRILTLQINPKGIGMLKEISQNNSILPLEKIQIQTRSSETTWELVAQIPWVSIGWITAPSHKLAENIKPFRVNLETKRSIAPAIRSFLNPKIDFQNLEQSLLPAQMR